MALVEIAALTSGGQAVPNRIGQGHEPILLAGLVRRPARRTFWAACGDDGALDVDICQQPRRLLPRAGPRITCADGGLLDETENFRRTGQTSVRKIELLQQCGVSRVAAQV